MNLEETIKRMELLSKYDTKKALNEWGEPECKGWLNIGVVPDSNPFFGKRREKDGNDMYIMVNPNAEQIDDMSTFRYRNVTYNTRPDGTGLSSYLPVNDLRRLKIYPEYRDTYYGDLFLGKRKGEQGEIMHKEFISNLNISGDKVILKHNSSVKITDGVIKKGKTNSYSNNSDIGIYFWGSKKIGSDPSNGQTYTYICTVPLSDVYDFEINLERFPSLDQAMQEHKYCAQYWNKDKSNAIVVNTFFRTPIQAIRDNTNGKVYNANWEEIDMQVESKKPKGNFINEYKPNTCNKADLVSINEVNAKSMLQRHGDSGFIVISPCRGFADFKLDPNDPQSKQKLSEINNQRVREMIQQIKHSGYSYTPVYGGFIENAGTEDEENVYERSFVIYNKRRDGSEGDIKKLIDFGQALAQQYNQESFLVKARGEKPKYITQNGDIDMEFSGNTSFNDFLQEYFTDLHKNTDKYAKDNNRKPTRFSYVESYINPAPQCYSERHIRSLNGEIFLTETSRRQKAQQAVNGKLSNLKSFAILTSDNPMGKKLSSSENASNYESLMKDLKLANFLYFPVKGKYNDIEHSVIIYNISLDDAIYLGDTYNQESIIYCIPNLQNRSVHYEYWERSAEGKPLRKTIERDEYVDATNDKDMFTQISRKFKIRIPFFEQVEKVCNFIESRMKVIENSKKLLSESMDGSYTGKHRMICRFKLYKQK